MKFNATKFIILTFIIPIGTGVMVNELVGQSCVFFPFPFLPCWLWNVFIIALLGAAFLDFIVYYLVPRIFKLDRKDVLIEIEEVNQPSYLQAVEAGISINNKGGKDIIPFAKIIGDIRQTEYFEDRNEKTHIYPLPKNNRVIGKAENIIEGNNMGELIFSKVENNENVSLLVKTPNLLKSFYSVKTGDYKVPRVRWDFVFEMFGKTKKGEMFKNGLYSSYIEAYMRNNEVFVQMGEVKSLQS